MAKELKQLGIQIFDLLNDINRSPDFYSYQSSKAFFPQLHIDGLGELALPLCDAQAKQLISLCNEAPYGKGMETVVDKNVRNTWELDAGKISNGNKKWQQFLDETLRHCEEQLDLQGQTLVAHPYKLLLYEEGSFFLTHQDTEKEQGMVATLVVTLPSAHQGGELSISHQGKSVTIDFSKKEKRYNFQSALFYADCHHEVSPVTEGYRLNLIYNICFKGKRKLENLNFKEQEKGLSKLINQWQTNLKTDDTKHLLIMLDHQYSTDGFSLNTLKGIDRSRADTLLYAAKQVDCSAYLCLLEQYEMYSAWEEGECDDLIEDYFSLSLINDEGERETMSYSFLDENNILRQKTIDDDEPHEEEYEGYMGNYGNTLSRWYRYAAVILWPKKYQLEILAKNNISAAIVYLKSLKTSKDVNYSTELQRLFSMVENKSCSTGDEKFLLLTMVLKENNQALINLYCRYFLFSQNKLPSPKKIQQISQVCDWDYLKQYLKIEDGQVRKHVYQFLNEINTDLIWEQNPTAKKLLYQAIKESGNNFGWRDNANEIFKFIYPLCLSIADKQTTKVFNAFLIKQGKNLSAKTTILPYLEEQFEQIGSTDNVIYKLVIDWLKLQFSAYYQRIEVEPETALVEVVPSISCNCDDCKVIVNFMRSNKENIELPRLKVKCEHLGEQVEKHKVQVTYSIDKNRRPWRFNMRKIGADQRDKIAAYKKAKGFVERLERIS